MTPATGPRATLHRRADGYAELPWASDANLFSALLPPEVLRGTGGVLDLGCGPGRMASWLTSSWRGLYVGVDASQTMLAQAANQAGTPPSVEFLCADIEQLTRPRYVNWAFVLSNVLHYVDAPAALATLALRLGRPRTVSVAETECPDASALEWVKSLFDLVWPGYRRRWFVDGDVREVVGHFEGTVVRDRLLYQKIDVDTWLTTWRADEHTITAAYRHFDEAPDAVAWSLGLVRCNGGRRVMTRRQRVLLIRSG
jgi:SAM-dependent methyltransferase